MHGFKQLVNEKMLRQYAFLALLQTSTFGCFSNSFLPLVCKAPFQASSALFQAFRQKHGINSLWGKIPVSESAFSTKTTSPRYHNPIISHYIPLLSHYYSHYIPLYPIFTLLSPNSLPFYHSTVARK